MPELDLEKPGVLRMLSKKVLAEIDNYCATEYDDGHRSHLGASLIGDACNRKLWYGFRWVYHKKHSGRQQRLFNRGHREEDRFIEWLKGCGFTVESHDLTKPMNEKGEYPQIRISGCKGHFGGSLDSIITFPESYGVPFKVLGEYKTNGTGPAFTKLINDGCALAKEMHYTQQCVYGYKLNLNYSLYLNICKNDDDLYTEVIKLDHNRGKQAEMKAERIIFSQAAPDKLSNNPTCFECKFCDFSDVCHNNKPAEKNCRSCKHAHPVDNAEWLCNLHNNPEHIIPKEFIKVGCDSWESILNANT